MLLKMIISISLLISIAIASFVKNWQLSFFTSILAILLYLNEKKLTKFFTYFPYIFKSVKAAGFEFRFKEVKEEIREQFTESVKRNPHFTDEEKKKLISSEFLDDLTNSLNKRWEHRLLSVVENINILYQYKFEELENRLKKLEKNTGKDTY